MLLVGAKNLREISLFPMNPAGAGSADERAEPGYSHPLRELALRVVPSKKD